MHTFGERIVVDPRTLKPLVGVAQVTDAVTGDPVATFTVDGDPVQVVSSSRGYVPQFKTPPGHPILRLAFPGGDPIEVVAQDSLADAAKLVDTVERGRLSEASLSTTIAMEVEQKAGNIPTFGSQAEALQYEADNPGRKALWFDAGYTDVTPTGPTWSDDFLNGGGTWTVPAQVGVIYTPATGTATPGETVTVTAAAAPGYALAGVKSWTHTFPQPAPTYFTDFTEYPIGQKPNDWTERWNPGNWLVASSPDGTGGVLLRDEGATVQNRILSWDEIQAGVADVEVVMKWRAQEPAAPTRPITRAGGTTAAPVGYHAGIQNASAHSIQVNAGGPVTTPATEARSIGGNVWYITRFRTIGNTQAVKTWPASQAEPTAWDLTSTDTTVPAAGWVGIRSFSATFRRDIDWVGVGLHGRTAPMEPPA